MKNVNFTNKDLKKTYNKVYAEGAYDNFFTVFNPYWIHREIIDAIPDWRGKNVLEIGCGQGELSAQLSFAGAESVYAIDYSEVAIKLASSRISLPNVSFVCMDGNDVSDKYDIIVMSGVLEHIDKPFNFLDKLINDNLDAGGSIISVMPSFMNPRGYVWMTLQILFDVPMSLTDINFFTPDEIYSYSLGRDLECSVKTFDSEWGCGDRFIIDFKKRLPNALRDAKLDGTHVEKLLNWLDVAKQYHSINDMSGAQMICRLSKK